MKNYTHIASLGKLTFVVLFLICSFSQAAINTSIHIFSTKLKLIENNKHGEFYIFNNIFKSSHASNLIDFDGIDDYIDFGKSHDYIDDLTIEAWILQENSKSLATIVSKNNISKENGYSLELYDNYPRFVWYDNLGNIVANIISPYSINNNKWYHIAVTYLSNSIHLYIDGIEVANDNSTSRPNNNSNHFIIGATYDSNTPSAPKKYFDGYIDEVRIWNVALSPTQIHEMMNQEIEQNGLAIKGKVVPMDVSGNLLWTDLKGYYTMNNNSAIDRSSNSINGSPMNCFTEQLQTAPLPYTTKADGVWTDNTATTPWTHGDSVWDEPNGLGIDGTPIDWNIVVSSHNISSGNKNITLLGLITDTPNTELTIADPAESQDETNSGQELRVTHYLKMDGDIDLVGESQLVQDEGSILDVKSDGVIERDQQGTRDLFTYNYWSSPVGISNITSNNNSYTLPNIFMDGTTSGSPSSINYLSSGYNGTVTPFGIADYWIWKFANKTGDDYSQWQHVRSTGTINAGEGFTMKGVADTGGVITQQQNYVFKGKPNNGDITLSITAGNEFLVGNPYPSAIDAEEFIKDNIKVADGGRNPNDNIINGAIYLWDHFANKTHMSAEYNGGYATYTLMGGTAAITNDARINATGGVSTKIPERHIPVGQGFFVSAITDAGLTGLTTIDGGDILFKNSQRIFKREAVTGVANNGSVFLRSSSNAKSETQEEIIDSRPKIRLMFDSPEGYHRELLVGADKEASNDFDLGYDAPLIEDNLEDIYWKFNNTKFIIQAVNNFNSEQILPLGAKINKEGLATLRIEELENFDDNTAIFIHDKELGVYHDLKQADYQVHLTVGKYADRFEITFRNTSLAYEDLEANTEIQVYFSNTSKSIILHNQILENINSAEIYNILGQSIYKFTEIPQEAYNEFKTRNLKVGSYIIKLETEEGTLTKKVLVQ